MTTLKDEIINRARVFMDNLAFKEHVERFLRSAHYSKVSELPAHHLVQFADQVLIPWESRRARSVLLSGRHPQRIPDAVVKPLVWVQQELGPNDNCDEENDDRIWRAETTVGQYVAGANGWFVHGLTRWNKASDSKAAAQADYEARILASLDMQPAPDMEALVEALRRIKNAAFYDNGDVSLDTGAMLDALMIARAALAQWEARHE